MFPFWRRTFSRCAWRKCKCVFFSSPPVIGSPHFREVDLDLERGGIRPLVCSVTFVFRVLASVLMRLAAAFSLFFFRFSPLLELGLSRPLSVVLFKRSTRSAQGALRKEELCAPSRRYFSFLFTAAWRSFRRVEKLPRFILWRCIRPRRHELDVPRVVTFRLLFSRP